jgi:hypothetical protein
MSAQAAFAPGDVPQVGVFDGNDTFDGRPIVMRFIWTRNPKGSKVVAKWQQAFSTDGGKTWEVNWRNEIIRDDHCKPTATAS